MSALIQFVNQSFAEKKTLPSFKPGDTVTIHYKIKEGDKERVQMFQGVVIKRSGEGQTQSFVVRKISNGVGVERIFPLYSPFIEKIEVNKVGIVRRAKLYYMRALTGKKSRIREKLQTSTHAEVAAEVVA